jgi:hypothetical protein
MAEHPDYHYPDHQPFQPGSPTADTIPEKWPLYDQHQLYYHHHEDNCYEEPQLDHDVESDNGCDRDDTDEEEPPPSNHSEGKEEVELEEEAELEAHDLTKDGRTSQEFAAEDNEKPHDGYHSEGDYLDTDDESVNDEDDEDIHDWLCYHSEGDYLDTDDESVNDEDDEDIHDWLSDEDGDSSDDDPEDTGELEYPSDSSEGTHDAEDSESSSSSQDYYSDTASEDSSLE